MTEVRLWAPLAHRADAVVVERGVSTSSTHATSSTRVLSMAPSGAGHWRIDLPVGTDYLLSIDGTEPRPDPRSRRQPFGVHGPSRVTDPASFAWTDAAWPGLDVLGKVFYELHVGTFTPGGTLDSAIERLPWLRDLGVDVVELMPIVPFPGDRGWGYDGVSLYAVHEAYGGPEALQRFVDAAHNTGLAVCLDVVYNHFGPAGNYAPVFAPYFTEKHHTPWGAAVNLDDDHCEGVRAFIVDNARQWIRDYHVDVLRLDAVHALLDDSEPHILAELSAAVDDLAAELGRPASLVAESDLNDPRTITPLEEGGLGMDAQWADDVHHALHSWLTGETFGYYVDFGAAETLVHALTRVFVHDGSFSTFRGRPWGAPVPEEIDRRRFVVFTQNHDQVGNRGLGDRPDTRITPGAVAAGAALLLLGPFTPLLFQGQEWGTHRPFQFFTDHDEELGALIRAGRTEEFATHGWRDLYGDDLVVPNPQDRATFEASRLDWAELEDPRHAAVATWHRDLIALRAELLAGGGHPVTADHGEGWFRMTHGPLAVVIARSAGPVTIDEPRTVLVASVGDVAVGDGGVRLGPDAVAVLRRQV